ncbi:MAG: GNAT family N-acetyltransferase [Bacilli bacterium]|nr:GNAT family N-acetyltransferase [Bacilli bacterium]
MTIVHILDYKGDGISKFDCGEEALNTFLFKYASQNDKKGIGRTYLGIEEGNVIGFFTLSAAEIRCTELPVRLAKGLPGYPVPAIRIARLAVDMSQHGKGYGASLLKAALARSLAASYSIAAHLVLVEAKPSAKGFYERYGFVRVLETESTYVLPMATIQKAMGE